MATVPPDPSYPRADLDETPQVLFDDPDADIVLRSGDSQTFRVLKLYIFRSSPVLGELIRAASKTSGAAMLERRLPEVQLYDSGTILSCLLTFIFPIPSVLPSSLDERMELLSVAQKYEMNSVIDHIRGSLSQQDPPFIHRENAFLAYSLAQKYGLRREAIQAARFTLKTTLTLTNEKVRAQLKLDLPSSGAGALLDTFDCSSQYDTDSPHWVHSYIVLITENPSFFDPIEFQMALMQHTTPKVNNIGIAVAGCSFCTQIPVEAMRTFWTSLAAVVHRSMEKGRKKVPGNDGLPTVSFPLPECLDISGADVVSPNNEIVDGLPVVDISEDAEIVRSLITILYPIPSEIPTSYDRILALLAAAQKYDMDLVQSFIRGEVARKQPPVLDSAQAFRAYTIASSRRLIPEMNMAASLTLDHPMTFEYLGDDLRLFTGCSLHELVNFRKSCRDELVSCFESFFDTL
ncbi:hypothetical protein BJY52DRAFT_1191702 [Lactarius psammicola]|nr:hypothetical protein BJY52DRAFT_1191702 [Lactarius psammicola]